MTSPYISSVQIFVDHFRKQGAEIALVASELHRKILYCSALDPLAQAVQAKREGHRAKLVHLLTHQTGWSDVGRVSLFQLSCHLKAKGRTSYRLYREVKRRLEVTPPRRKALLSMSPLAAELLPFAKPEEQGAIELHTYAHIFYTYRNNLIHEYREPGYGTDWSGKEREPFYTSISAFGERELVFPITFVRSLYENALVGVEAHLMQQKINPHSRFDFGSHWR